MSSNLKPWLLLGTIFVVGVVTGSALTIGLGPHFKHAPGESPVKRSWMAHLTQKLDLTADQQAKIEPIVTDAAANLQSVHRDEMAHGAEIFKTADEQIEALLTPEQKVEFQKMESEREKMFSGHMRPHGGPGGAHHHDGTNDAPANGVPPPPGPPPAKP